MSINLVERFLSVSNLRRLGTEEMGQVVTVLAVGACQPEFDSQNPHEVRRTDSIKLTSKHHIVPQACTHKYIEICNINKLTNKSKMVSMERVLTLAFEIKMEVSLSQKSNLAHGLAQEQWLCVCL